MKRETKRMIADEVLGLTADGYEGHLLSYVSYDKGGANIIGGGYDRRGYWLIVRVEERGHGYKRFTLFTGGSKTFLEECKALSPKRLASIEAPADKLAAMQAQARAKWTREHPAEPAAVTA